MPSEGADPSLRGNLERLRQIAEHVLGKLKDTNNLTEFASSTRKNQMKE
jgi:hypothetical protein